MTKQKQWRNANKRVFEFTDERLGKAYRLLFGLTNPAGCSVCGEDEPDLLGIYPHDSYEKEWRILCNRCHSALTAPVHASSVITCLFSARTGGSYEMG